MAAKSNLRIEYHLLCRAGRELERSALVDRGRGYPERSTRFESGRHAPPHAANFTPPTTATKLAAPAASHWPVTGTSTTRTGTIAKPIATPRTATRAAARPAVAATSSGARSVTSRADPCAANSDGIAVLPLSCASQPYGCDTSKCPAMLNENRRHLTTRIRRLTAQA